MKTGISTASFFLDLTTEDAAEYLSKNGVRNAETFLSTFSEYTPEYASLLKEKAGNMHIHSVHTLNTQFEPQLYSKNPRAYQDAWNVLKNVLSVAKTVSAPFYTFHGFARIKRTPIAIDYDVAGDFTARITEECKKYGVSLAYENVHWCYYNYVGFFSEMKKRAPLLRGTLDVKQARQSGVDYREFLSEMGESLATVHLSDVTKDGKMCLPGYGTFDLDDLFRRLSDVGFNGAVLIEAYRGDFGERKEIFDSLEIINEKASKYFTVER